MGSESSFEEAKRQAILDAAEREAWAELAGESQGAFFTLRVWDLKKRILKEKYGIDWKTPREESPEIDW
jgi:hypothetical protein